MTRFITCNGRRFLLIDGRRVWLEEPPVEILPDLLRLSLLDNEINHPTTSRL